MTGGVALLQVISKENLEGRFTLMLDSGLLGKSERMFEEVNATELEDFMKRCRRSSTKEEKA